MRISQPLRQQSQFLQFLRLPCEMPCIARLIDSGLGTVLLGRSTIQNIAIFPIGGAVLLVLLWVECSALLGVARSA